MTIELKVPSPGESITEVIIAGWMKKEGDAVDADETVVEIDSDKSTLAVGAPSAGVIKKLLKREGDTAQVGEVIALIDEDGKPAARKTGESKETGTRSASDGLKREAVKERETEDPPEKPKARREEKKPSGDGKPAKRKAEEEARVMPAARRAAQQRGVDASTLEGTGPGGRVLKEDVEREAPPKQAAPEEPKAEALPKEALKETAEARPAPAPARDGTARETEIVRMTTLRKRIAQRLVEAQHTAAILTTFNEIDMSAVAELRAQFKESFEKKHGIKLGMMSFFVKAAVDALKLMPQVNARIDGDNIIFHNYQDIGVAVGGGKGLVVPVIRNAERLSFAEIELTIADLAKRAQTGAITPDEMQNGTFTISNGGIYGSMLSTPILNPPQSAILGMHAIQDRAVVRDGQVVIRPIMYVALSYDHRLIDGREAVTFLKRIKECIESPARMLMEV